MIRLRSHKKPDRLKKKQEKRKKMEWCCINTTFLFELTETFGEAFLKEWNNWSLKKKITFITILLLVLGVSAAAIAGLINSLMASQNIQSGNTGVLTIRETQSTTYNNREMGFFNNHHDSVADFVLTMYEEFFLDNGNKIAIFCHPESQKMFSEQFLPKKFREIQRSIKEQIKMIKELLPQAIHPTLLEKISADPTFSIQIRHSNFMPTTPLGKVSAWYDPVTNTISLTWQQAIPRARLLLWIRNENFHAALRERNYRCLGAKKFKENASLDEQWEASHPFYDHDWTIKPEMAHKVFNFLKIGEQKVNDLHDLFERRKNLAGNEKNKLLEGLENISDYQTHFSIDMPRFRFNYYKENGQLKVIKNDHALYMLPKGTYYDDNDLYIVSVAKKIDDESQYSLIVSFAKDNSLEEIAKAFFIHFYHFNPRDKFDGHYDDLGVSAYSVIAEKCSDVYSWPHRIRRFYSELCEYFRLYLGVDDCYPEPSPEQKSLQPH